MAEAETQLRELLRQRHRLQPYQDDDFNVRNLSEILQAQEDAQKVMTYLLAAIASVSLLVGGIGIMNIMLVSVTERTREIGLRMAVGARGRDILGQFLVEAVTLALIGGLIGIAMGLGGAEALSAYFEFRTLVAPSAIAVAFGFAAAVGRRLRLLPRPQGVLARPDRRAPLRVTRTTSRGYVLRRRVRTHPRDRRARAPWPSRSAPADWAVWSRGSSKECRGRRVE